MSRVVWPCIGDMRWRLVLLRYSSVVESVGVGVGVALSHALLTCDVGRCGCDSRQLMRVWLLGLLWLFRLGFMLVHELLVPLQGVQVLCGGLN